MDGIISQFFANLLALSAVTAFLTTVRSIIWWVLELPTIQVDGAALTLYLTGIRPIVLDETDIATIALQNGGGEKFHLLLNPVSDSTVCRSLAAFDRIYFHVSRKLFGSGFRYTVVLPSQEQVKLLQALRARFDSRLTSQMLQGSALPSQA